MDDLNQAKQILSRGKYTCVLCRDETVLTSQYRGVRPLLDLLDSGKDLSGFSAADKVVGRATAFLYCLLGVRTVHGVILSDGAAAVLAEHGVVFSWDNRVSGIRNRDNTGPCPMEQATWGITDPKKALAAIRKRLAQLQH